MSNESASGVRVETSEDGSVIRTVTIEVEAARVDKAFDRMYREVGRTARVRGFRPGKVPRSVLEKMYGATLPDEVQRALVSETLADALELAEVVPVSEPDLDHDTPTPGQPFTYRARVEVRPEIALPDLSELAATRSVASVDEAEVQSQLEALRERNAQLIEEPEDTLVANEHVLQIDFVGRIDGEPFEGGSGQDVELEIGSGRMLGDFEEQLVGAVAGDDREVTITFPDDYGQESLRGKQAVFAVHVASVRRRVLPELDDEFAKDIGDFETLEALRDRVRIDMVSEAERTARQATERSLMDSLIARTDFEVPPGLVERQLQQQLQQMHQQFQGRVPPEALQQQLMRMQEEGRESAERRVREAFLLSTVARENDLEVSDDEIGARFQEMAEAQGVDAPKLRAMAHEQGWQDAVEAELLDQRVLDFLLSRAKVEETTDT